MKVKGEKELKKKMDKSRKKRDAAVNNYKNTPDVIKRRQKILDSI